MNNVRTVMLQLVRTYARKLPSETAGIHRKLELSKSQGVELTLEDLQEDDLDEYESDFMAVGDSYTQHKSEEKKSKEQLKHRIVRTKYFEEAYPRFLTYTEKEQIKQLHASDPEEWTVEKLSKSFPALPETITKILKANWVPKTVESIIRYDKKVIENWKSFKTGKLALDPVLKDHIMKFRNRHVSLTDRETLIAKFIPPKMEFPKPRSRMFLNILNSCTSNKQTTHIEAQSSLKESIDKGERQMIATEKKSMESMETSLVEVDKYQNMKPSGKKLTFNEFMKDKLNNLYNVSPEEGITLLSTYRKYIESANSEDISSQVSNAVKEQANVESRVVATNDAANENALTTDKTEKKSEILDKPSTISSELDTYIKEWKSSIDTKFEYANRLKIPRNAYKEGATYRVKDCYYDDDGEFLYRIPGLRS